MWYALSFVGGIVVTIIVEFILVYVYGRRAANERQKNE